MNRKRRAHRAAAIAAAMGLLLQPSTPLVAMAIGQGQTAKPPATARPATAKPATPAPATAAAQPAEPPIDGGWPRVASLPSGGSILVYQPQISCAGGRIVGAEALARWRHPLLGPIGPDRHGAWSRTYGRLGSDTRGRIRRGGGHGAVRHHAQLLPRRA